MNIRKLLALAVTLIMIAGAGIAYETIGESVPTTECNDGIDNDGDGLADENDPGCNRPYYKDDQEADLFDPWAAYVFGGEPGKSDASIYYGGVLKNTDGSTFYSDGAIGSAGDYFNLNETYIDGSTDTYGGGQKAWSKISGGDGWVADNDIDSNYYFIGPPSPEAKETGSESDTCGDGIIQDYETTENCPIDMGLPQDADDGNSEQSLSETLGSYTVTDEHGDPHTDQVKYVLDLSAREYNTEGDICDGLDNIECNNIEDLDSDETVTLEDSWSNAPDFVMLGDNSVLTAVYPEVDDTVKAGEVTDYDISSTKTVDDYSSAGTDSFGCSGENCTTGSSYCTSVTEKSDTEYELTDDAKYITYDSQNYTTSKSGDINYSVEEDSLSMAIKVKHDDEESSEINWDACTQTETSYGCEGSGGCDLQDDKDYYTSDEVTFNDETSSATRTYDIKTLKIVHSKIFSLDPNGIQDFTESPKEALFQGDDFLDLDKIYSISHPTSDPSEENGWFAYEIPNKDGTQSNDFALTPTMFQFKVDSDNNFVSDRKKNPTYSPDGSQGNGDGYIAIDNGEIVGSTPDLAQQELKNGGSADFVTVKSEDGTTTDIADLLDISCPGDSTKCVASVDLSYDNLDGWSSGDRGGSGLQADYATGNPHNLDSSLGACKMYQRLSGGDREVKCEPDRGGGTINDDGEGSEACGDQPSEYYIYMEGPEVNEDNVNDYPADYEMCIDTAQDGVTKSSCNLRGEVVPEGHVADIAPPSYGDGGYEQGGNSPDAEVCLDLEGTGLGDEGDYVSGDNKGDDLDNEDYGGEWYDLDSEMAQEYIRGVEDGSYDTESGDDLVSDGDSDDPNDIAYYWNSSVNPPQNNQYNPQGGRSGTAMEDDCGNPRFDNLRCDDQNNVNDRGHGSTNTFFSFFTEGRKDEDFQPQGANGGDGNSLNGFRGTINKLQESSNQLEPGMDTTTYDNSDYNKWQDTRGGQYADSWAISLYRNWSIDSTGMPYPPYSTWYRDESDIRTSPDSSSVGKKDKAFGNSYAAVDIDSGDGVWIDPDSIKSVTDVKLNADGTGWRDALSGTDPRTGVNNGFKIDLTGEDAGIGIDVSSNEECLSSRDDGGCKVVAQNLDWEKDDSGTQVGELEKPVCGDDRQEYLIEQAGESESPKQYSGPYACSNSLNSCYDSGSPEGERVVEQNGYRDVDEPGESEGRLKDDKEICQKFSPRDDYAVWYDQDYKKDFCNQNTLYGQQGVRWFNPEYLSKYPQAVRGGIDDSWNDYLEQHGHDSYTSDTSATSSEVNVDGDITPVDTGTFGDKTATLGFCGGDDESEYLVTQECKTRYCETDRSIQGVAKVPGSCVLRSEGGTYETSNSERSIYRPGEQVEVTGVSGNEKIACFNGVWFADWPVNFNEEQIEVPVGETRTASFDIVNIRNSETTFRVTMEQSSESPSADQFSQFVSHSGNSFTTTVKPTTSKTFRIEITGGNENLDIGDPGSPLTVRAEGVNSGLVGSDSVDVGIEPAQNVPSKESSETRDVPGVGGLQLVAMMLLSTLVFFTQRRS